MVVTSRMLAAHTNGYPIDVRSRFWSNYYRSLKGLSPLESYWDSRSLYRTELPPAIRYDIFYPWWHHIPALCPPYVSKDHVPAHSKSDIALRPSFLSPVKRTYVWHRHPKRLAYCH